MTRIANATTETEAHEEIEITNEMIEAGTEQLSGGVGRDLHEGWISSEEVARAVYLAMRRLRPSGP
jgi:hypothetical protein